MKQKDKPTYNIKWTPSLILSWVVLYLLLILFSYFIFLEYTSNLELKGGYFLSLFAIIPFLVILGLQYLSNNLHQLNYPVLLKPENYKEHYQNARTFLTMVGYFLVLFFMAIFYTETKKVLLHKNEGTLLCIAIFLLLKLGFVWFIFKSFKNNQKS